jgi:uncharacterized membrane-anchored protein YhcB (DUF1043 family)
VKLPFGLDKCVFDKIKFAGNLIYLHILRAFKYLICLFALLLSNTIKSQDPEFKHIDKAAGLPSNSIYNIFQDSKGFMWFSCDKGLIKYDGFEFITYSNKLQSSKSGTNIQEDECGRIWYQNFDGYLFYVEQDSLHLLQQNKPAGYYNYGIVGAHLFVIQTDGLDVYDIKSLKRKTHIPINIKNSANTINDNTNYYVYNDTVLHIINKGLKHQCIKIPEELNANGYSLLINSRQNILFYSRNTKTLKHCFTIIKNKVSPFISLTLDNIQNAAFTNDSYWFCTTNGAYRINKNGVAENKGNPYFKSYNISYVYRDRENNFWFSTLNNGLLFVKNLDTRQYGSHINPIRSALIDDRLYVGANEGKLYRINLADKTISEVYKSPYNKEITTLYYDRVNKNTIVSNNEIEILDHSLKSVWQANGALKDVKLVDSNYYAFALSGTCGLYQINKNKKDKWAGIYNKYKIGGFDYARFMLGSRAKAVEYNEFNSTVYFGTSYGLMALTPDKVTELKIDTNKLYINKLCKYNNTIYGLSSGGDIITIRNHRAGYLKLALPDKHELIGFIKVCGHYLLLASNYNLYRIDLADQNFELKLQHKINYDITDMELWNNELEIITKNGIITEQLNTSTEQKAQPLFYINRFMVNSKALPEYDRANLNYDQNTIEIVYSILSFKTDFNYPLYYNINDGPWERASEQARTLKLSSLAPGNYKITFKPGEINNNNFSSKVINFTIKKAWWQTWWFIGICILAVIFFVILIARWRINELKQKNKLLNEKIENEQKYYRTSLKAIKAQMNPHFFYNALNTIQSFIYSEDKKNASTYLSKFSRLTRLILEMSEKDNITLSEEINTLQIYLDIEKVRFNDDFEFSIKAPQNINTDLVLFPPMLIQPYVENAIKHGLLHKKGAKNLQVTFEIQEQLLLVTIDDNGIGRKLSEEINARKNSPHVSFSGNANEERFKILSAKNALSSVRISDKFDSFNASTGTTVHLAIPVILTQK